MFDFSKNYFELFGLPVGFLVDGQELAVRYRELQKVVHPDRFAAAGEQSQRLSLQSATLVNEAYATLKDPLKRAQYLLTLNGIEVDAQRHTLMVDWRKRDRLLGRTVVLESAQLAVQFEESGVEHLAAAAQTVQKMQFLHKLHAEAEALEAELEEAL